MQEPARQDERRRAAPWGRINPWLRLLRAPNLLTVPGDPLAGAALAMLATGQGWHGRCGLAALASVLLYGFGLIHNDIRDLEQDRRDSPDRPLPSGRIRLRAARLVAVLLAAAGLGAAVWVGRSSAFTAIVLLGVIVAYNDWLKRVPVIGPLNMGACRGLSLLLGAAAVGPEAAASLPVLLSAAGLTLYIAAVTAVAARETESTKMTVRALLPALVLAAWMAGLHALVGMPPAEGFRWLTLAALAVLWAGYCGLRLLGRPAPALVQRTVGWLIRGLLPVQAALIATGPPPGAALAILLLLAWPASALLARRFYAS